MSKVIDFWKLIKSFLTNKGFLENAEIMLNENDKIVTKEKELVRIFNDQYINIVECSCGTKPTNVSKYPITPLKGAAPLSRTLKIQEIFQGRKTTEKSACALFCRPIFEDGNIG